MGLNRIRKKKKHTAAWQLLVLISIQRPNSHFCVTFVQSIFEKPNATRQGCRVTQPALVKLALKPYQLASVSWMADIEDRIGESAGTGGGSGVGTGGTGGGGGQWLCSHVLKCQSAHSSLLFDVINNRVLCQPVSPDSCLANFTVRVKGGILAGQSYLSNRAVPKCVCCYCVVVINQNQNKFLYRRGRDEVECSRSLEAICRFEIAQFLDYV